MDCDCYCLLKQWSAVLMMSRHHLRWKEVTHENTYKRNVVREARIKGEGYITYKGKQVSPKAVPKDLSCMCRNKCYLHITNESKTQIWDYFYSLESKDAQDTVSYTHLDVYKRQLYYTT